MALTKVKASNITLTTAAANSNDTTPATTQYVTTAINNLIDGAPATLNTLDEIAAALNDDAALNTTLTNAIAAKLPLAGGTMTGTTTFQDGAEVRLGTDNDMGLFSSSGTSHIRINEGIFKLRSDDMRFTAKNGTTEAMRIVTGDRVGIGINPRAGTKLDIYQQTNRTSQIGGTRGLLHLQDGDTPANNEITAITFESNSNNAASIIGQTLTNSGSQLFFGTSNNYSSGVTNTSMMIGWGGNVSIGTTGNSNRLTVSDATNISMSAGAAGQLRIEGAGYSGAIALDGDAMHIYQNSSARDIVMGNNETEQFRITAAGNISTNALSAVSTAGGGIWYDAANKYLSISHWASNARPTPAAMLHLSDNSNDIDVPQIRIEGRENPGDTRLDIAVKDAEVRLNMVEGPSGDASVGYGLFTLKTNAAANTTYPRRGGFKFDVNTTTPVEILNTGTLQLHGNSANWSETTPGHAKGSIHLDPDSNTNDFGNAITFGASDHNNGESTTAGIYLRTDGAYGSKMYLATSDSYASGAKMAMRINHSGHIHAIRGYITSQVPAFNAYYSGNSYSPGGNSIFAADSTRFNNGGNFNTSNYRFTAPADGVYRFYFRTITNGSASNQHLCFRKNGTDISGTNQHFSPNSGTAWCQLEMETVQDLSDGDFIDVRFVTLTIAIHGNAWNEFSGHLIG